MYLKLCLPYVTVLHLGKEKSSVFLRLYLVVSQLKRSEMYDGTKLVLTLYINMALSWSLDLLREPLRYTPTIPDLLLN